ncbi:MAG: hypothetical protein IT342_01945 [Candidatus Melainabacteria bacterium]|nr:hypothetical protein [Candidatus Melainabacteria bacterium]
MPFDPGANEWYQRDRSSGWQSEAMALDGRLGIDNSNARVQPNGCKVKRIRSQPRHGCQRQFCLRDQSLVKAAEGTREGLGFAKGLRW